VRRRESELDTSFRTRLISQFAKENDSYTNIKTRDGSSASVLEPSQHPRSVCWRQLRYSRVVYVLEPMVPHHSSAILMCERATITDAAIRKLCETIVSGQQSEIDQMAALLRRLEPR